MKQEKTKTAPDGTKRPDPPIRTACPKSEFCVRLHADRLSGQRDSVAALGILSQIHIVCIAYSRSVSQQRTRV